MNKQKRVDKIVRDIKSVKIQGARNIAKFALSAYSLVPTEATKRKLENARPTEPMLVNTLKNFEEIGMKRTLEHFSQAQEKINKLVLGLINNSPIILTHCHSTNVINALIYAKKHGKKFQVYNTETRPLFQGRKTSMELSKNKIKVTMITDLSIGDALSQKGELKKADIVLLGADAILKSGVINKNGSNMISELAHDNKIPVYIIADSWKFSHHNLKIEERNVNEIWDTAPKNVKILNPAFEFIQEKYIQKIVSELGILSLKEFVRKV